MQRLGSPLQEADEQEADSSEAGTSRPSLDPKSQAGILLQGATELVHKAEDLHRQARAAREGFFRETEDAQKIWKSARAKLEANSIFPRASVKLNG